MKRRAMDDDDDNDAFSLVKQVFPNLDFMGWYSIGTEPSELDLKLHEQVSECMVAM